MEPTLCIVDAFTNAPFSGNPAAVCWLQKSREDYWMQHVAMEMNLSETAFITPHTDDGFHLRWFTPTAEIDLCGHATLAAAHFLWEEKKLARHESAIFHTNSGMLTCDLAADGRIWMDFPERAPTPQEAPRQLLSALGVVPTYVGRNVDDILVVVESAETVRNLEPDTNQLLNLDCRGVIVTAKADDRRFDFVSRCFLPSIGISEDPVTGSAHCCLAPYWSQVLHKTQMIGLQVSARGGIVHVMHQDSRVRIAGEAVTVLRGELVDDIDLAAEDTNPEAGSPDI